MDSASADSLAGLLEGDWDPVGSLAALPSAAGGGTPIRGAWAAQGPGAGTLGFHAGYGIATGGAQAPDTVFGLRQGLLGDWRGEPLAWSLSAGVLIVAMGPDSAGVSVYARPAIADSLRALPAEP
jgi:hypothetical protein